MLSVKKREELREAKIIEKNIKIKLLKEYLNYKTRK
jgi:hypothetical protein